MENDKKLQLLRRNLREAQEHRESIENSGFDLNNLMVEGEGHIELLKAARAAEQRAEQILEAHLRRSGRASMPKPGTRRGPRR